MTSTKHTDVNHEHRREKEPIALIGIGCRFPGANGPQEFWRLLKDGVDAITEVPATRFDIDLVHDPRPGIPGKISSRGGGFIKQVDHFDAAFFGISPREALRLDPQQRLLLEVTWEALEDAGIPPGHLATTRTGVFIGACSADYEEVQYHLRDCSELDLYAGVGTARSVLSGRISYVFDLRGPSLTVDTACSSSLVAVHLACQSIWSGESELAIAGGVNLILLPERSIPFSRARMLSPDSHCKFGDATADGFVRSDGIGVVLLKPLSKAQADQDSIYAVILGTAMNNDGRSSGLLATPGRGGQQAVLAEAYRSAGISPGDVQYVEAHGTGTAVGDPVEVQSLGAVLAEGRPQNTPCILGSVKSNIGHAEGAAGIAGLIKTSLCINHKVIPPSLHFHEPNPAIPWGDLPLVISRELTPWPKRTQPALAAVSAFGISATNAHVVLQEAPKSPLIDQPDPEGRAHVLAISAHNPKALERMAAAYRELNEITDASLRDICYSASVRRAHLDCRLAIVARTEQELGDRLSAFLRNEASPNLAQGRRRPVEIPRIVFVFSGQGSQWLGMGCRLMTQEPVFRRALADCDAAFRRYVEWSVLDVLQAHHSSARMNEIDVVQPCLFAIQVALARLWQHWGIQPEAVAGQSLGEVAAAYVAGGLSLEDAAAVICRRSLLLKQLSGKGGMMVVGLSLEETEAALTGFADRLSIAVSSSPTATVIAGDARALQEMADLLQGRDVFCNPIKVDVASHSPAIDSLREPLLEALAGIRPRPMSLPLFSTVTGEPAESLTLDAEYWAANLRRPVLFFKAVRRLLEAGYRTFIEVSPHPVLSTSIQQSARHLGYDVRVLSSIRHDEDERTVMLSSLARLHVDGCPVDWEHLYADGGRFVHLPSYAWQPERYWLQPERPRSGFRHTRPAQDFPSIDEPSPRGDFQTYFWDLDLRDEAFCFLGDHRVDDEVVLPAAAYIDMALTAARSLFARRELVLEHLEFRHALALGGETQTIQLAISPKTRDRATFEFFSLEPGRTNHSWVLCATGAVRTEDTAAPDPCLSLSAIHNRSNSTVKKAEHYQSLSRRGLHYGPSFQGVEEITRGDGEAVARVRLPEPLTPGALGHSIHPALLDSCFQVLAAALPSHETVTCLPVGLERLRVHGELGDTVTVYAAMRKRDGANTRTLKGDLIVCDGEGQLVVEAKGIALRRLAHKADSEDDERIRELLYTIEWRLGERPAESLRRQAGLWIVFCDTGSVGPGLIDLLEAGGERCVKAMAGDSYSRLEPDCYRIAPGSSGDYARLLRDIAGLRQGGRLGVAHLWSLDAPEAKRLSNDGLRAAHTLGWNSVLELVKALAEAGETDLRRLWLVTRGTQAVTGCERIAPAQSPLWGLGRVIAREHPGFRCSLVDLDEGSVRETRLLWSELAADSPEDQIALRGDERFVARLVRHRPADVQSLEVEPAAGLAFKLEPGSTGLLDDLTLSASVRRRPGPGEIEIQVHSVGLNFRDVMLAMGALPSDVNVEEDFGWECSGKVVATGDGVSGLEIGQDVMAIANPCFGSYATTDARLAVEKPGHLSFEEGATLPLASLTAHYALHQIGRLKGGERVLIHSAAGGVGLAAVRMARRLGAELFATAGSEGKRAYLKSLGIRHVFDSRSLSFADQVMEATQGEGVDVILNTIAGEAIQAGLSILRLGGRFLELGRRDIYQNAGLDLEPFRNNLSFCSIDLASLIRQRPGFVGPMLREALSDVLSGAAEPLPLQVFSISDVSDAFQAMARAKHVGKIALRVEGERLRLTRRAGKQLELRPDATYLVTGGLGGLGLSIAQWMVGKGARHIVLMSRGGPSDSVTEVVAEMRRRADVVIARADVANIDDVRRVLDGIDPSVRPLKGVVHAAGVLDDGILLQLDRPRFDTVMTPKIDGALILHTLTLESELDFFVLFSSAAGLLGSAGQGNYSAANAFLDCLAHYRRSLKLPALSIDWGPWSDVGLAARGDYGKRLAQGGIESLSPGEGTLMFERILQSGSTQVAAMRFDYGKWRESCADGAGSSLFARLATAAVERKRSRSQPEEARLTRDALAGVGAVERAAMLQAYLKTLVAQVLGFRRSGLEGLDVNLPIELLGVDSLMALELKTHIECDLGINIPILDFLKGASINRLAARTIDRLPDSAMPARPPGSSASALDEHWEELSL